MIKNKVLFIGLCLFIVFSCPVAFANPILKMNKEQLEKFHLDENYIDAYLFANDEQAYGVMKYALNKKLKPTKRLTIRDVVNPAIKMHIKKEFGLPITPEDIAMAERKWSPNPLLDVDNGQLKKWLYGSACKDAYTLPGKAQLEKRGSLTLCIDGVRPRVMFDTGVELKDEMFIDPQVIEKAKAVLEAEK